MHSLVQALVSGTSCTCKSTCERTYPVPQHLSTPTHQMVRFQSLGIEDPDGSIHAHLQPFGTVDKYLTAVAETLPYFKQGAEADEAGQRAHAAVLQQLSGRTPQFEDGTKLYERVEATRLMPLGCSSLDAMLGGGLRETTVTEISGETCSGKTQLCHLAAVTTAQRSERVVYFDTTNCFSAGRLPHLIEAPTPEVVECAVNNVTVVPCHSIHALLSSLDELAQQATVEAPDRWPKLVIVDSISALLSPVIGASQHNQGHVIVAETARLLRHTADALQCSILVTNHVVGAGGSFATARDDRNAASSSRTGAGGVNLAYKPALGEQWRGAAHVRLQLSRAGGDLVAATLLNHTFRAPGTQAWFRLGEQIESEGQPGW